MSMLSPVSYGRRRERADRPAVWRRMPAFYQQDKFYPEQPPVTVGEPKIFRDLRIGQQAVVSPVQ